jgi:hypothetical protein
MAPGCQSGALAEADMGKAKMREYGSMSIAQEAFIAALRMGEGMRAEQACYSESACQSRFRSDQACSFSPTKWPLGQERNA